MRRLFSPPPLNCWVRESLREDQGANGVPSLSKSQGKRLCSDVVGTRKDFGWSVEPKLGARGSTNEANGPGCLSLLFWQGWEERGI